MLRKRRAWHLTPEDLRSRTAPERKLLPERFLFAHDVVFTLHDSLGWYLAEGMKHNMLSVPIPGLSNEEDAAVKGLVGDDLAAWLEENRPQAARELTRRQSCGALLGDALNFLYEAICCAAKGKLTVAFALLRKPLRDNLFLLECLLGDPDQFVDLMAEPDLEKRTLRRMSELPGGLRIVEKAVNELDRRRAFSAQMLYDIRFNKNVAYSLEPLWDKALHLVTANKKYRTEQYNLNFVFSNEDSIERQWECFYTSLPLLLAYYIEIAATLIPRMTDHDFAEPFDRGLKRDLGFSLLVSSGTFWNGETDFVRAHQSIVEKFSIPCPLCAAEFFPDHLALLRLYIEGCRRCDGCGLMLTAAPEGFSGRPPWRIRLTHWWEERRAKE